MKSPWWFHITAKQVHVQDFMQANNRECAPFWSLSLVFVLSRFLFSQAFSVPSIVALYSGYLSGSRSAFASVLQCVAVCSSVFSVLQCVAVCCIVLQCDAALAAFLSLSLSCVVALSKLFQACNISLCPTLICHCCMCVCRVRTFGDLQTPPTQRE